jgi:hypothetical protein
MGSTSSLKTHQISSGNSTTALLGASATFTSVPSTIGDTTFAVPRILNNVESHVRIRYVNDGVAQTGTFSLQTKYSNAQELGLLSSIDGSVNGETPTQITKAIIAGEELDGNLQPTGIYKNVSLLENDALKVGIPPTTLFQAKRPTDPTIPTGSSITIDPILNVEPNVVDSGWVATSTYGAGSLINIIADTNLEAYIMNSSDDQGNNIQGDDSPTLLSEANIPATIGAPFFDNYFRIVVVNTSGGTTNEYSIKVLGTQTSVSPVFTSLEQPIFGFFPAPLSRSVNMGKNPNEQYVNTPSGGISDILSTDTPLGISGNFTSSWVDVQQFGEIKVSVSADVESDSCKLELSHDGITVDTSLNLPPQLNPSTGLYTFIHSLNPSLPYFRINYTNGTVAQSSFKLKTILLVNSGVGFVSRATQVLDKFTDVKNIRTVNSPEQDRNFGFLNYQESKRTIGRNAEVPGAGFETIWNGADNGLTAIYPTITTAETVRVRAGGNANDDIAGTGARKIQVDGLDQNFNEVSEIIELAGASASAATTATFRAVNEVCVIEWGTFEGENAGVIIIENTSSTQAMAAINTGVGRSQGALYTVPANKTMYITSIVPTVGSNNTADLSLFSFKDVSDITSPVTAGKFIEWEVVDYAGAVPYDFDTFLKFDEKTFIRFDGKRNSGSGNAFVSIEFRYILVDN